MLALRDVRGFLVSTFSSAAPGSRTSRAARSFQLFFTLFLVACFFPLAAGATLGPGSGSSLPVGSATSFTGDQLRVLIDVDASSDPGNLVITLSLDEGYLGDLRGVFFQVADESLLGGLSVMGDGVTSSVFDANAVIDLGQGANLNGKGSPCPCDFGVEIGTPGIGQDDYATVTFSLSHETASLDASFLRDQLFGVRVTSVGWAGLDKREGSSKTMGVVPEPTTALLMLFGLGGLAAAGSPRRGVRVLAD